MSRAWMPFYVGDYLRDTMHLSALQHGMYLMLICHYWERGGLPSTASGRARVAKVPPATWANHEKTIGELFSQPGWHHKRIDEELAKYERLRSVRRLAGSVGGTKTQVNRYLRQANAKANASSRNQTNAQANGAAKALPSTEEKKEEAAAEKGDSLKATPLLEAEIRRKGWR